MKKFKISILLISIIMFSALISSSLSSLSMVAIAAEDNLELENVSNAEFDSVAARTAIVMEVTQAYQFRTSTYPPIASFPINSSVFNSNKHYFCVQHGVPYGGKNVNRTIGEAGEDGDWWVKHTVTKGKATGQTSDPFGDIDTSADFYVNSSAKLVTDPGTYEGYKEKGTVPKDTAYTNWVYTTKDISFDCESGDDEKTGLAFLFARYLSNGDNNLYVRPSYNKDPMQSAVWASWLNLGSGETSMLASQANAFVTYHNASNEPNVDVEPGDNVGTTISGSTYTIGPFKMSDYVEAKDYRCDKVGVTEKNMTQEEIENTQQELEDFDEETTMGNVVAAYTEQTLQDALGTAADMQGTIIKAEAILSNGSGTKTVEIPVPEQDKDFNINLSTSDVGSYDELYELVFTYQRIHASSNGRKYIGTQYKLTFTEASDPAAAKSSCTYKCTEHNPSYAYHGNTVKNDGGSQTCKYTWTCWDHDEGHGCDGDHSESGCDCACSYSTCPGHTGSHKSSCYTSELTCSDSTEGHSHKSSCYTSKLNCSSDHTWYHGCAGNHWYSWCHCSCPGHSDTHTSIFECGHRHQHCEKFYWKWDGTKVDVAQDGYSGAGTLSNELRKYRIRVEVPIKTDMTLDKYIADVEHQGDNAETTIDAGDRSGKDVSWKKNNSVKIERGDKVTYKIVLKNNSRFSTDVRIKDILPKEYTDLNINSDIEHESKSGNSSSGDWITVPANDEVEYTVTLIATALTGNEKNEVFFTSTNEGPVHMRFTKWSYNATHGEREKGNIVNIATGKQKDSDYYTIKQYDITIDKYITNVKHKTNGVSTFSGTGRMKKDEGSKKSDPVWVEYGDVVTYQIDIYNTNEGYMTGTNKDREGSPYWSPDIVYVDLEDILPKKYSDLKISVDNGTGSPQESGGKITFTDLKVSAGKTTTITIELVIEEVKRLTLEENNVKLTGDVLNVNKMIIKNNSTRTVTSDWYKINDYNVSIDKFISAYDGAMTEKNNTAGITNETNMLVNRQVMTEEEKEKAPLHAEKTEIITYKIIVKNDAVAEGTKYATQVRPSVVRDEMDEGLTLQNSSVAIKSSNGTVKYSDLNITHTKLDGNVYEFRIDEKHGDAYVILDPGDYIEYTITVEVTKTNMYLYSLRNTASFTELTNINSVNHSRIVTDQNITPQEESSEYVKLKDLVIAGKVWLDTDKDGYMGKDANGNLETGTEGAIQGQSGAIDSTLKPTTGVDPNKEFAMKNIVVKLYTKDGTLVRTTKTDENGLYTFGRDESLNFYNGTYCSGSDGVTESEQRVPKATNKDANKNYQKSSELIEYYIEYEYDGLVYKSTAEYAYKDNLKDDGALESEATSGKGSYKIDSNATELDSVRSEFNIQYEKIAYNKAGTSAFEEPLHTLEFDKRGHESFIKVDPARVMKSRSFIIKKATGEITSDTDYLWLYKGDNDKPETEYLKYINLGLEIRDQFDLRITKDLMSVDVDINGYDMNYEYGLVDQINDLYYRGKTEHAAPGKDVDEGVYDLYLYKSDYNYRYEMYQNEDVRKAKGKESELEVVLNYKITIYNDSPDEVWAKVYEVIDFNTSTMELEKITFADGSVLDAKYIKRDESAYNHKGGMTADDYKFERYETNYITGLENKPIKKGEFLELFLTYRIDKQYPDDVYPNNPDARKMHIDDKYNVAQIGAYGAYGEKGEIKALVDCDSNAGNINNKCVNIIDKAKYEDNTFRIITNIHLKDDERTVSGFVFEDTRSEEAKGTITRTEKDGSNVNVELLNHYIGDGIYDGDKALGKKSKHAGIEKLLEASGMTVNDKQDLEHDTRLDGMTVELIEIVTVEQKDASGNVIGTEIYEEIIDPLTIAELTEDYKNKGTTITDEIAKEILTTASGRLVVRTQTGSDESGKGKGEYTLDSFIPGEYIVRFKYGDIYKDNTITENSLLHNGQDYRSTDYNLTYTYNNGSGNKDYELNDKEEVAIDFNKYEDTYTYKDKAGNELEFIFNDYNDIKYAVLSRENYSDARDNEFRRIEIMAESERMTNGVAEFMKYTNYDGDVSNGEKVPKEDETVDGLLQKFSNATMGFADTVRVKLGVENDVYTINQSGESVAHRNFNEITVSLDNVDYGVTFRPENFIKIEKKIKNITLTTSTGEELINIEYDRLSGEPIEVKSTGLNQVMAIDTQGAIQGFRYIQVDESILQGSALKVEYYMTVNNIGEVDTVNKFLINKGGSKEILTALDANRSIIQSKAVYGVDRENYTRVEKLFENTYSIEYDYGQFVGDIYYRGIEADFTEIAIVPVSVSKILDFVDNDAAFVSEHNREQGKFWATTTEKELLGDGLIGTGGLFNPADGKPSYYKDDQNRKYVTYKDENAEQTQENLSRSNLAVTASSENENKTLVYPIIPIYSYTGVGEGNNEEDEAYVIIQVDAILGADNESEMMVYDNVAEVVEFITPVGRRTNFASTIGNIKINGILKPFDASQDEPDSDGTEVIRLTPPTGKEKFSLYMAASRHAISAMIIMILIIIVVYIIKLSLRGKVGKSKFYK